MSKLSTLVCDYMERGIGTPIGTLLDVCVSMPVYTQVHVCNWKNMWVQVCVL